MDGYFHDLGEKFTKLCESWGKYTSDSVTLRFLSGPIEHLIRVGSSSPSNLHVKLRVICN